MLASTAAGLAPGLAGLGGSSMLPWALGGAAGISALNTGLSTGLGFKSAADARDFMKFQMKNKYQLMVKDLEKAGLNPILALGSSGGVGGAPQARVPLGMTPDLAGGVAKISSAKAAESAARLNKEKVLTEKSMQASLVARATSDIASAGRTNIEAALRKKDEPVADMQFQLLDFARDIFKGMFGLATEPNSAVDATRDWAEEGLKVPKHLKEKN